MQEPSRLGKNTPLWNFRQAFEINLSKFAKEVSLDPTEHLSRLNDGLCWSSQLIKDESSCWVLYNSIWMKFLPVSLPVRVLVFG